MPKNQNKTVQPTERIGELDKSTYTYEFRANGRFDDANPIISRAERDRNQKILQLFADGKEPVELVRSFGIAPKALVALLDIQPGKRMWAALDAAYEEGKAKRDTMTRTKIG